MADDVTVANGGTPFDVATDDDGSGNHIQLFKLVYSADASRTPIPADANGLLVKANAVTARVQVTPTISTSAYANGDAVGALLTFANALPAAGSGVLEAVTIVDKASQAAALDLVLFRASITAPTDNAAFDPTDAELADYVGHVVIGGGHYSAFNDNAAAMRRPELHFDLSGTSLYGVLVARGTPTYAATTDIVVTVQIREL